MPAGDRFGELRQESEAQSEMFSVAIPVDLDKKKKHHPELVCLGRVPNKTTSHE